MKRKIELLAPGGEINSIKAAILGGANAIYCGLEKFNARNRAANISFDDLHGILRLAHKHNCEIFITLNIIIVENEIPALISLLNKLVNTGIDGVIIQDLGMFYLLSKYFKSLDIHASTQLTTHNAGQIKFLSKLKASRVNLCREMNIHEIKDLSAVGMENNVLTEVFVHGSNCISFSGLCYISSVHGGNSGNRGRCSQPCRDRYITTAAGRDYPLNMKDNSAFFDFQELYDAGVASLKIEGRIKKIDYVYTVVNTWRKQIDSLCNQDSLYNDDSDLYKVFNRDFSNSYLKGDINSDMFIDNPRDYSIARLAESDNYSSESEREEARVKLYDEKDRIMAMVESEIAKLDTTKQPLKISLSGASGEALKITVQSSENTFEIQSAVKLAKVGAESLNNEMVLKRLKAINETGYYIDELDLSGLKSEVFIPFKELTSIKKRLLFVLNGSKELIDPVEVPVLKRHAHEPIKPTLSVLISSAEDVDICSNSSATIYYQLPNTLKGQYSELKELIMNNAGLVPCFPSLLIGEDYADAVKFIDEVKPELILTNNTGIAYEAYERGISWIAGPYLNIANSYSLLSMKEEFNCAGSFITNELNKTQIKSIKKPEDFKLYYSIYHPIVLMTSRQCFSRQVDGCNKYEMDEACIQECSRISSITDMKKVTSIVEKSKGNYNCLYNETNFMNTDIVTDVPDMFDSFFIDLRDIKTATKTELNKLDIINMFEKYMDCNIDSKAELKAEIEQAIQPTTKHQYKKGI